jgi:formylmethanofuran dehydrogenase subunit E
VGIVEKTEEQEAKVRIFPEYCNGLKGIEVFSHVIILYWMHQRDNEESRQTLLVYQRKHAAKIQTGVFACRSPSRPNPIGLSIVELIKAEKCVLTLKGLDAFEGSPIIDINPYNPKTNSIPRTHAPTRIQNDSPA